MQLSKPDLSILSIVIQLKNDCTILHSATAHIQNAHVHIASHIRPHDFLYKRNSCIDVRANEK